MQKHRERREFEFREECVFFFIKPHDLRHHTADRYLRTFSYDMLDRGSGTYSQARQNPYRRRR